MKAKSKVSKVLALTAASVLTAGISLVAGGVAPSVAQAVDGVQTISVTPAGPYKGGEKVTIVAKGFSPNVPVAIGQCPVGRPIKGPGVCGATKLDGAKLTTANAQGVATVKLTIIVGSLQNTVPPDASCGPKNPCYMSATCISNAKETTGALGTVAPRNFELTYVGATVAKKTTTKTETSTSNATTTKTTKAAALPKTGPKETAILALFGLALFQIGLIFAVRATRATPRRARL
ncbi:MAG: LPXTG cell wall anchor domain-containing protein [Actinobacteria bacterium]|nr:LPXTG cell wall anchor domain-containing protein [Actinomycetota bacterium]